MRKHLQIPDEDVIVTDFFNHQSSPSQSVRLLIHGFAAAMDYQGQDMRSMDLLALIRASGDLSKLSEEAEKMHSELPARTRRRSAAAKSDPAYQESEPESEEDHDERIEIRDDDPEEDPDERIEIRDEAESAEKPEEPGSGRDAGEDKAESEDEDEESDELYDNADYDIPDFDPDDIPDDDRIDGPAMDIITEPETQDAEKKGPAMRKVERAARDIDGTAGVSRSLGLDDLPADGL